MELIIRELNGLADAGVVRSYAIGGAVGALFYLEPTSTEDVDVFVVLADDDPSSLTTFSPVFTHFLTRGHTLHREFVMIGETPVQFLPAPTALHRNAVRDAREFVAYGLPVRVIDAPYLAAIALDLGRAKADARLVEFLSWSGFDHSRFDALVLEHQLGDKWGRFRTRFPDLR